MSAKVQLGSILSCVVLLIIIGVVVITGNQANEQAAKQAAKDSAEAKKDSAAAKAIASDVNQTLNEFFEFYNERVTIGNKNTNNTQKYITQGVKNIIGNLTDHRIIQNLTREEAEARQNETLEAIHDIRNVTSALTGPEYEKLSDQRVNRIIGNLSEDHEIIFKALNISKSDNETDAEFDTENLGQLLKEFIQDQKVKQNEPKGPKVK